VIHVRALLSKIDKQEIAEVFDEWNTLEERNN
jgi:hypothetical protein